MTRNETLAAIIKGVHADLQAYKDLRALLETQFQVALKHDADRMAATVAAIEQIVSALDARRRERVAHFATFDQSGTSKPSIEPVLAALAPKHGQSLAAWWLELESLVAQCIQLNSRNGKLMASQNEIFRRVFDSEPATYSPA